MKTANSIILSLGLVTACGPGKATDTGSGDATSSAESGETDAGDGDGTATGGDGDGIEDVCVAVCDKFADCWGDDSPGSGSGSGGVDPDGGTEPPPEPTTDGGGGGMSTTAGDGDGDGDFDPDFQPRDECSFSCIEEYGWSGQISEECAVAYLEMIKCISTLNCSQLERWEAGLPNPCSEVQDAYDTACEEDWGEEGDESGWGTVTDTAEGESGWGESGVDEGDWGESGAVDTTGGGTGTSTGN